MASQPNAPAKSDAAKSEPTKAEADKLSRDQQREADAKQSAKDYKPKSGKAFDAARSFVTAQMDIAYEVQERYTGVLTERADSRDQLRALYRQGLLTADEAVEAFVLYPERKSTKNGDTADENAS